ncbi:MAG: methylmalonyl-CoA mutase, partial [Gammaproteobacteria bacterium]
FPMYVMTSDYGAASQLEKIDMLDFAEVVVLNKYDRRGAEDALRDVRKQWRRNRVAFKLPDEQVPVYPTIASQFNDPGVTWMFANLCRLLREKLPGLGTRDSGLGTASRPSPSRGGLGGDGVAVRCDFDPQVDTTLKEPRATVLIPGARVRYLAEIAEQGRTINSRIEKQAEAADRAQALWQALHEIGDAKLPKQLEAYDANDLVPVRPE